MVFWQNHGIWRKSRFPWFPCFRDFLLPLVMFMFICWLITSMQLQQHTEGKPQFPWLFPDQCQIPQLFPVLQVSGQWPPWSYCNLQQTIQTIMFGAGFLIEKLKSEQQTTKHDLPAMLLWTEYGRDRPVPTADNRWISVMSNGRKSTSTTPESLLYRLMLNGFSCSLSAQLTEISSFSTNSIALFYNRNSMISIINTVSWFNASHKLQYLKLFLL